MRVRSSLLSAFGLLVLFVSVGLSDTPIPQDGAYQQAQGASCAAVVDSFGLPKRCNGLSKGCTNYSIFCGGSYNVNCPLVNFSIVNSYGTCKNGGSTNCDQWNPFWCAVGVAYIDPDNTGLCVTGNQQCGVYAGYSGGYFCAP